MMRIGPWVFVMGAALGVAGLGCAEAEPASTEQDAVAMSGPIDRPGSSTEVWAVRNAWSDTSTPEAAQAGIAWDAGSGLSWEEKYAAWVQSLDIVPRESNGKTFAIRTPFGDKQLPAPHLDCGEVAYTLRVAFSSWYHLPFFVRGWHEGKTLFAGHFGFVNADGSAFGGFPAFRDTYADHEDAWSPGAAWPTDAVLRKRRLGDDDRNVFLETDDGAIAGAGVYFDEIFLNKRAGHFARLLLLYFGSVDLASGQNLYQVEADAIRAGDVLLKRSHKTGTGHTVPVLRASRPLPDKIAVEVASGNIPRRQPLWEDTLSARHRFTTNTYGGPGENSEGEPYAKMGGGLKRWRAAELSGGRWNNVVLVADRDAYIPDAELERIAARTDRFGEILLSGSPEEQFATAQARLDSAREHLMKYPASCSKRSEREQALTELYRIGQDSLGLTLEELDAKYRRLDDAVLGELIYEQSKTCCWNSTTPAMYAIIMSYAEQEQAEAAARGECVSPTVFRAEDAGVGSDGYQRWRDHAAAIGRAADWATWSEDELCTQRDVLDDTLAESASTWCSAD